MKELDPKDHIDRLAEQELFSTIVRCETPARILTICDRGGRGKSSLLKRLQYNCQYQIKPAVPCCLLELDNDKISPTQFDFAAAMANGFALRGEDTKKRFATFRRLDDARTAKNFAPFEKGGVSRSRDRRVMAVAEAKTMHGGQNIGVLVEGQATFNSPVQDFTEDQERQARERCVEAIFDDLRSICAEERMVLILDGWEKGNLPLRKFIRDDVLGNHVLDPNEHHRPKKLVLVIAGRPYDPGLEPYGLRNDEFKQFFSSDDECNATVKSIKSLSEWDSDHIREFLVINGCKEPTDSQVGVIREQLSMGRGLETILDMIDRYFRPRP